MKILDGGFGTTLRDTFNYDDTHIWSLAPLLDKNPDIYLKCHQLFVDAGANIITTANYSTTPYYLDKGCIKQAYLKEAITKLGELAQQVKITNHNSIEIAGCIPPYGESYAPKSIVSDEILSDFYQTTATCLANNCDFYLAETIASEREAILLTNSLQKYNKPIYLSFCIDSDGKSLLDGSLLENILNKISNNINGIMFNCCPISHVDSAIKYWSEYLTNQNIDLELGAYPNKHKHICQDFELETSDIVYSDLSKLEFKEYCQTWKNCNIDYLGGCCGISPEYIKVINELN